MGYRKEQAKKLCTQGFTDTDMSTCHAHTFDDVLTSTRRSRLSETVCIFCERTGTENEPAACLFDDFLTIVVGGMRFHYRLAQDELAPSFDGDWQIPTFDTLDTFDVVEDKLGYGVATH